MTPYDVMLIVGALPVIGIVVIFAFGEVTNREGLQLIAGLALWCCIYAGALHLLS